MFIPGIGRVFHAVVTDQERRLANVGVATSLLTSTGSESGRSTSVSTHQKEVDEEERMATTSTDGGELVRLTPSKVKTEFLLVLTELVVTSSILKDGLVLRNQVSAGLNLITMNYILRI